MKLKIKKGYTVKVISLNFVKSGEIIELTHSIEQLSKDLIW